MPGTPLRFYFDYVSPNAYLAWTQLPALAERHHVTVEPVPVLFAGLLGAHGRVGPAEVPVLMRWMWKNILRKATGLGVPFNPPAFHPFNPLLALRVSSLPPCRGPAMAPDRRAVPSGVGEGASRQRAGRRPVRRRRCRPSRRRSSSRSVPETPTPSPGSARRPTTRSLAGVFGVPSMEVRGEIFWGYDDWPQLARFLEGADPLDPDEWKKWEVPLRASAVRPR